MCDYLDFDEVECINKALEQYRKEVQEIRVIENIDKLFKIFPRKKQYFFDTKNPFNKFKPEYRELLKKALTAYCSKSPPDLPIAMEIVKYLQQ